ncbi:MAG TPA: V-type ATP synthase subunit F [Eubacteriales bacterium]|jgi:V/A-type H+/Na+-transporting ATPase subunit F|nr:V-type ATP synthase subunit F [Clostridia bacterium]HRV72727.1 V-type ATP synthase subunit F [Eubacteriales bacterium]
MAKMAVIGDRDSVLLFRAVGLDVFGETDGERANMLIRRMAREGYAVIYLTEQMYSKCSESIAEFASQPYPAIIPIPDANGTQGVGMKALKQNVEKAVGVDILFMEK